MRPPTPEQFDAMLGKLRPCLAQLGRLRDRLIARGFTPGNLYLDAVADAWSKMHELTVRTHYLSCSSGVGGANRHRGGTGEHRPPEREAG